MSRLLGTFISSTILFGACAGSAFAETTSGLVTPSVSTPINLTEDIQTQANRWQLNQQEYEHYLDLMRGPLGRWNPDLDPLLALGMFAETAQQEQRYAELYAQQEFDLTERTLKFQQAYREAFNRLYRNVGITDQRLLAPYFQHEQEKLFAENAKRSSQQFFEAGDRLLLFAPRDCPDCGSLINHLASLLVNQNDARLDVYVLEASDDEAVREWAINHSIGMDWLRNQRLTLNRDEGLFQRILSQSTNLSTEMLPIFLNRNGEFFQLDTESLAL